MTFDEESAAHSEHIVEITQGAHERNVQRRSLATLSVALCLALAAVGITAAIVDGQSSRNQAQVTHDALQREQLRQGWETLATVAAANVRAGSDTGNPNTATDAAANAAASQPATAAQPAAPSVIIVNVPQSAATSSAPAALPGATPLGSGARGPSNNGTPAALVVPAVQGIPNGAPLPNQQPAVNQPAVNQPAVNQPAPNQPAPNQSAPNQPAATPSLNPVTFPSSQSCGLSTCNVDSVCCNPSCGICIAPGETCSDRQCG